MKTYLISLNVFFCAGAGVEGGSGFTGGGGPSYTYR